MGRTRHKPIVETINNDDDDDLDKDKVSTTIKHLEVQTAPLLPTTAQDVSDTCTEEVQDSTKFPAATQEDISDSSEDKVKRPISAINKPAPIDTTKKMKTPPRKIIKMEKKGSSQYVICVTATAIPDLEVYHIEHFPGQDGYTFHLWQQIMQEKNNSDIMEAGFIFCGDRRTSKTNNTIVENVERARNGSKYSRRYILRSLPDTGGERESTPLTRDEGLHVLLKVRYHLH